MAKLYFRHGTMGAAKTLNLLAVAHNYRSQGKSVILVKPQLDTRFGENKIRSRTGLEAPADFVAAPDSARVPREILNGCNCILADEAQFLPPALIEDFHLLARDRDIPIICYGLRTDFQRRLFPGSQRLLELADAIEEIKTTCHYCQRKAVFNLRLVNGTAATEGPQIQLGAEESYLPVCKTCYHDKTKGA